MSAWDRAVPWGVRPAGPEDADALWPLARSLATSFTLDRATFDRSLTGLVARPEALLLVAVRSGGGVVGYLAASARPTLHANGPVAWVDEVMVDVGVRRSGVGRALLAAAEAWSADRGCVYVSLSTRRAPEFYRSLGYAETGTFFRKVLTTLSP